MGAIDVDGDGITDVLHGDFVSRVFATSGHELKRVGLRSYTEREIKGALGDLRYLIKIGKIEKPAGIIMPISFSLAPEFISNRYLELPKTAVEVEGYQTKLHERILEVDGTGSKFIILKSFFDFFKEENIPIFLPAGNNYSTKINMAGLLGSHTVGAHNYHNTKIAAYSDQSLFTTIFRQGDVLSTQLENGIDINGDQIADFLNTELSGKMNIVLNRGGMDILIVDKYTPELNEFFISSRYYNKASGIKDESILNQIDQEFGELIHYPSGQNYRVDQEGNIVFSPINTDVPYVQYNYGTSFAIGNICN